MSVKEKLLLFIVIWNVLNIDCCKKQARTNLILETAPLPCTDYWLCNFLFHEWNIITFWRTHIYVLWMLSPNGLHPFWSLKISSIVFIPREYTRLLRYIFKDFCRSKSRKPIIDTALISTKCIFHCTESLHLLQRNILNVNSY